MLAVAWLVACSTPALPEGVWSPGDLHVHSSLGSNDTDGLGTAEALGPAMEAAGLAWLVLTDHSNAAGSMSCDDVEDCPNQGPEVVEADWPAGVILGSEISPIASLEPTFEPTGHVGCVPADGVGFVGLDHFVDRPPGEVSGGSALAQCSEVGGWAIVNHPYAAAGWITYDWTSEDFDALEVFNGGTRFDPWDAETVAAWEERGADGRDVVPVGGSDCHRWGTPAPGELLDPALGWPTTSVHLRDGEGPVDALRAGRVVIEEPGTVLRLVVTGSDVAEGPGGAVAGPAVAVAEASAEVDGLVLQLVEVGGGVIGEVALDGPATLEVEVEAGAVYARVWPADPEFIAGQGGVALTGVVWVE